ncbi:MAG: reductive dehalogenase [Planctomycetes bacterium]|nr:reductive dehalogenase [Planctomycetota bacterium]
MSTAPTAELKQKDQNGKIDLTKNSSLCHKCTCCRDIDTSTGFKVKDNFQRFSQKNDIYNRVDWDKSIRSEKTLNFFRNYNTAFARFRDVDGFRHKDYAIRNAAWHITDYTCELKEETEDRREGFLDTYTLHRPGSKNKLRIESSKEISQEIKKIARFLGADLVGVCKFDKRWIYNYKYSRTSHMEKPIDLPTDLENVIVIAVGMDYETIKTTPSALSDAATGQGYTKDLSVILSLAQYIRNLGYQAVASLNDTALSIPLAIQAGLGEYGRLGLLITKEFGPRVRIGKVFTDLPLAHDKPIKFGVEKFCSTCRQCTNACPTKAITDGKPSDVIHNKSNLIGVQKWSVDAEKCFNFWVNTNAACAICIRVCPYNKDYSKFIYRIGRWLAGTFLRKLMLKFDILLGYGKRKLPNNWWNKNKN